jgi:hypothetical protein
LKNNRGYIMKKLITTMAIAAILPASISFAAPVDFVATNQNVMAEDLTGASYVVSGFSLPTSTGVSLFYDQSATIMAVGASNAKGTEPLVGFGGSTEGGVIAECTNVFSAPTPIAVDEILEAAGTPAAARSVGC